MGLTNWSPFIKSCGQLWLLEFG